MSALALLLALGSPQYDAPKVPDPELAAERGGFTLPNGIGVAIAVNTQTAVNGALVLQTVFRADQGAPTLTAYAPKAGETVSASSWGTASVASRGGPTVTYDRASGIQVTPGSVMPGGVTVSGGANDAVVPAGLQQVAGGATTDAGLVTEAARGGVRTVELSGADLTITHFAGNAFGSAIANSGSDRAIDTQTSVSIDLSNAGPDVLGSAMLRATEVAVDAVRGRF